MNKLYQDLLRAYNEFCVREYNHEPIETLENPLSIAYTTLGDNNEYECQLEYDIEDETYRYYVNYNLELELEAGINTVIEELTYCDFEYNHIFCGKRLKTAYNPK